MRKQPPISMREAGQHGRRPPGQHRRPGRVLAAGCVLAMLTLMGAAGAHAAERVNGDFVMTLLVNGQEVSPGESITVDPAREVTASLHITDVTSDVELRAVSVEVLALGSRVASVERPVDARIAAGRSASEEVTFRPREELPGGDLGLATGLYEARVRLDYRTRGVSKAYLLPVEVRLPGNPLTTPVGALAGATAAATLVALLAMARAVAAPAIAVGSQVSGAARAIPLERLRDLASERLEPTARGRVVATVTRAAHKRISRDRCPVCRTPIRHGHCHSCRKSAREVRQEYAEYIRDLTLKATDILRANALTADQLARELGVDLRAATDVLAVARHARLIRVRGLASKLTGKALLMGINAAISSVLWAVAGGLARLTPTMLVAIVAASLVLPLLVTRMLRWRTRRALARG